MSNLVSVVTPVATYHDEYLPRAIASVQWQSVPCEHLVIYDDARKGAGWARNQGLLQVTTPYVVFLDADDTIEPQFVERCLAVIRPQHYVYTDWIQHNQRVIPAAPRDVWMNKTYHVVTTLLHTVDALAIGGFDELLPAIEDTDFYVRLRLAGVCGIHVPEPLFQYREGGQRSKQAKELLLDDVLVQVLNKRYGGYSMACCGGEKTNEQTPANQKQEGDVLMLAAWNFNKMYFGRVTGRKYGYTGHYQQVWIAPEDVAADVKSWVAPISKTAPQQTIITPNYIEFTDFAEFADKAFGGGVSLAEYRENSVNLPPSGTIAKARKRVS